MANLGESFYKKQKKDRERVRKTHSELIWLIVQNMNIYYMSALPLSIIYISLSTIISWDSQYKWTKREKEGETIFKTALTELTEQEYIYMHIINVLTLSYWHLTHFISNSWYLFVGYNEKWEAKTKQSTCSAWAVAQQNRRRCGNGKEGGNGRGTAEGKG